MEGDSEWLDPAFKHPVVLDSLHPATKLLIQDYDARLCHLGPERVFAEMPGLLDSTGKRGHSEGATPTRGVPHLPVARLRLYKPPFYSTGVDCFGPFQVKIGQRSEKRWGIIYKCLTTWAVHLDLMHSMDADSLLMSLRQFISRRGTPAELYSDQGSNFKAGEKELRESFNNMSSDLQ